MGWLGSMQTPVCFDPVTKSCSNRLMSTGYDRTMRKHVPIIFPSIAPGGCASLPLGSSIIARIRTADVTSSFSRAFAQSPPVDLPVKGVRSMLDNTDHVFALPNNLSCYKVFELAKAVSGTSTSVLQVNVPVWVWTSAR